MPELPEVETIKNDLKKKILNKKIVQVEVNKKRLVKNSLKFFISSLRGREFKDINRRGKLLYFSLPTKKYLLVHLKMTGQLVYCGQDNFIVGGHANSRAEEKNFLSEEKDNFCRLGKNTHIIFKFFDNSYLFFNDLRQFGYMRIADKDELARILSVFGIEPLKPDFVWTSFDKILSGRRASVKAVILNQKLIAGIGNIYADESLFRAGIRPDREAGSLSEAEKKKLFSSIQIIIKKAIKYRGTTFSDYIDGRGRSGSFKKMLKIYGREGKKCLRCGQGIIKKIKIAGRGTRYCSFCQK